MAEIVLENVLIIVRVIAIVFVMEHVRIHARIDVLPLVKITLKINSILWNLQSTQSII